MLIGIWLSAIVVGLIAWYLVLRPDQYTPSKVFTEKGQHVYIGHTPLARLNIDWAKPVPRQSIVKIQLAGNCISLFNAHDNAIDINIPWANRVRPIYQRAKTLFSNAEAIEIEN